MSARIKKILLLLPAIPLLLASGWFQKSLNRDRAALDLTISQPLQNAPPLLAFTTVALGGFRGLISNFLWIRANDLQQNDKFFEAAQLASWITDLEPHFSQVWVYQGWNMAFNISVKFKDFSDRWRWVENGMSLMRDDGLRYNPDDILIYREIAWLFQFKMGDNLDDANGYYKAQWAKEMTPIFGTSGTNFAALLQPGNTNAILLEKKYKENAAFAEKVNEKYGPFDWRLPEAHAIYWAALGLEKAKKHPEKVKQSDLIMLRRVIFQSMQQAFRHGRIISNPFTRGIELAPNLALISKVNDSYLQMYAAEKDEGMKQNILTAHRNFLRDAVYFLYENDQIAEAQKWFDYLCKKYPNKPLLDGKPDSLPKNMTLDDYAIACVQEDVGETSQERVTSAIQGMLLHAYLSLAIGQNAHAAGYQLLAQKIYDRYQKQTKVSGVRVQLPPMNNIKREVLNRLLDPKANMIPFAARAVLRTQLGMPAETNNAAPFSISTNTVVPSVSTTNVTATNSVGK